ncbi:isoaspartyl peptidase/L-asparaginase-like isoform X1 [Chrysemys picta bellii]|uniref:isoaspartyl peptidase/L-asparaginase-like isoform X1 n=1 Tax=Chrysemys picta bellii TaxID=8478 RepID=UPI00038907A9|nr:isoaspartyl peptidase/L-asparaginase-like isoform X1 [Chrysemys picta bellii]XP_023957354.1 isoaspartyl peptidase/L-asparaginase-like isoform X1 [Chrysemys picta bellii]XP_042704774.1 isoaspartyl peptidase/L-asparaginase-like isoform X1 [Chrysemys picta bellii]
MGTKPVLVVHGGAWAIPDEFAERSILGVKNAVKNGFAVLEMGGSSMKAVEIAVRALEDDAVFDAGHGAVLNADGYVELDAIIMNGKTLAAGAVSCIRNISNPVTFACSVLEKTPYVMLTGTGANQFAEKLGIPQVPVEELVTDHAKAEWEQYRKYKQTVKSLFNTELVHDTVGAVAIDCEGNMACATSTGGITNKMVGRVGDTPVIGSGGYADNLVGAVSATGHGESIMKVTLARLILFHMEQGDPGSNSCPGAGTRAWVSCFPSKTPEEAADSALHYMERRVHGRGGVIVVSKTGEWTARFTTKRMAWAGIKEGVLMYGLNPGETIQEIIKPSK